MNTGVEGEGNRGPGRARIIDLADPGYGEDANEVQGHNHNAAVSVIVVDAPPGSGPKLHMHPYEEVFVIQEGSVTFTAGDETIEATGGQVVVVPAGVAHKFANTGTGRLRQVDIHASERFVTEWLE
ncbi:MAG: cupin domain-containing protein [Rubrobacteraceae bacterium]|nr:cupin domain-containing protein [Rubrobacteraceae bacterium]